MQAPDFTAIEDQAEKIVRNIGAESVSVYCFLADRFKSSKSVVCDDVFRFVYRSFYRLDNAGLTLEFKLRYFELLEQGKATGSVDVESVVKELYAQRNRKQQRSLQFSFATKLANMVDDTCPIYDAEIARVFWFEPSKYQNQEFESRLNAYKKFHDDLRKVYDQILREVRLPKACELFHTTYDPRGAVPKTKVLDFIFWSTGKLRRKK